MEENNFNVGQHEIQNLMEIQYRVRLQEGQTYGATWRNMILLCQRQMIFSSGLAVCGCPFLLCPGVSLFRPLLSLTFITSTLYFFFSLNLSLSFCFNMIFTCWDHSKYNEYTQQFSQGAFHHENLLPLSLFCPHGLISQTPMEASAIFFT